MTHSVVPDDYSSAVDIPPVRILFFMSPTPPAVEHDCKTFPDGSRLRCAPYLHHDHIVIETTPLTIHPSILCPDCGLHGWVREGRWVQA